MKLFLSRHSLHVLSVQTEILCVHNVLKNDTSFLSSGGRQGFYHFKGLSRNGNNTVVLVYLCWCCCTSIPFKWLYSRIRIHVGGNSGPRITRSCSNLNNHSAASWEDADLCVVQDSPSAPRPQHSVLHETGATAYRSMLCTFSAFDTIAACPETERAQSLTLFLLMKIVTPIVLPNYVEKLFHLCLGTAVPADVQFLPLIAF